MWKINFKLIERVVCVRSAVPGLLHELMEMAIVSNEHGDSGVVIAEFIIGDGSIVSGIWEACKEL